MEAYENRSLAMMNLMEASPQALDRAIYLLEKATDLDPNYAAACATLGTVYDIKGSFLSIPELAEKAAEVERRAIRLNPKLADAHRWLRSALMALSRFDEAIDAIQESIKLEPDDASTHSALGRAYWIGKGTIDEGIRELERAITINPDLGYAYLQLGLLYALRGDYGKAEAACRSAIDLEERYASGKEGLQIVGAYTRLGYVYYRHGRYDEAIGVYERQLASMASSEHALRERSLIELNQKLGAAYLRKRATDKAEYHFKLAVRAFENRLAREADNPFTKYYISCLYALNGDVDRAVRYLEESLGPLRALNLTRAQADPDFGGICDYPKFLHLVARPAG